ncbi:acetyltransferase AlgX (SGNH hydrolase-like protein) [Solirubrobacter pauli]|uniref:Acetyltransferase AlgX (SGNH hydrolase-like protein) n=1 Tax=Solirubrobacter pauli TaxID=166793 RepID=A0A660LE82_9ACTN|nr:hypothetical protein [Solirubrobacter pauli]RKQ92889.1 acetyltransferase AlgX (SGNH hydrolase-like protein) [Solirubrobacter pauli]
MRKLVAAFALLFFFAPLLLWVAGVRARPFENRPMASRPQLSQGWEAFDGATRFFVDRLPLREQAVRANTWVSLNVFDTTPDYGGNQTAGGNPSRDALPFGEPDQPAKPEPTAGANPGATDTTVLKGKDGWLFLQGELARACAEYIPWARAMQRWERMLSIIRASGRDVVLVVPPDKSTIYPEYLPDAFAEKDCYKPGRAKAWKALEGTGNDDVLPLREAELAVKAAPPEETYHPEDTHWNSKGAALGVRALLRHLGGPAQLRDADLQKGRVDYQGDLSGLVGTPKKRDAPLWTVKRNDEQPEVTKQQVGDVELTTQRWPDVGDPLREGRTVFVQDSFGVAMLDALGPYFSELQNVPWFGTPTADLLASIEAADTVILEKVERDINFFASDGGMLTEAFLGDLEAALR